MDEHGFYQGRHFTAYVHDVQDLMLAGDDAGAERLLLSLLDVVEAESEADGSPLAPWYYKQLRRIYLLRGDLDAEVALIERHNRQPHRQLQASFEHRLAQVCRYAHI
jgi:hypothetical protein